MTRKLGGGTLALKIHVADEDDDEQVEMRRPRYGIVGDIDSDGIPADEQDTGALSQNESEGKVAHQASQPARHDRNPQNEEAERNAPSFREDEKHKPASRQRHAHPGCNSTQEKKMLRIFLSVFCFLKRHADPWLGLRGEPAP